MVHATVKRESPDSFTVTFGVDTPLNNKRAVPSDASAPKSANMPVAANTSLSKPAASAAKSISAASVSKSIAASGTGSASGAVVTSGSSSVPSASASKSSVVDAASAKATVKEAAVTKARAAVAAADKVIGEIFTKIKGKTMEGLTEEMKKKEGMRRLKDEVENLRAAAVAALTAATEADQAIPSDVTKRMITFATAMGNRVNEINESTIETGKSGTLLSNFKKATKTFDEEIKALSPKSGGRRTYRKRTPHKRTHRKRKSIQKIE